MANAFTLWGELKADTSQFERSMKVADSRLKMTAAQMETTAKSTRNLVGALATAGTAYAAWGIAKAAIDRTTAQARANRLLSASATEAGISFDSLSKKNANFAKAVGLSNAGAAETTSNIARLASGAGLTGSLDKLLQSFADLGAARGIVGEDLNNLIGTILSGQDEGLNRLGISDPGKLYEAYAKSVGRSVESLTQQEKVQAAVNAVMEKAALFTGAAQDRMNSFDGQIAKTTSQWENFLDAVSKSVVTSGPVTDFFNELSRAMDGVGLSADQIREKLRQGMTPKEIAKQNRPSPTAGDWLSGLGAAALAPYLVPFDLATGGLDRANRNLAQATPWGTYQRRLGEDEARIAAEKAAMEKQDRAAYDQRVADSTRTYQAMMKGIMGEKSAKDIEKERQAREQFLSQSLQATQAKLSASQSVAEASLKNHLSKTQASEIQSIQSTTALKNRFIQEQLQNERAFYQAQMEIAKPEERAALEMAYASKVSQAHAEMQVNAINAQVAIREQMKRTREEISSIFISNQAENPFVQIFDSGRLAIERVTEATRGLNPALQQTLLTLTKNATAAAAFGQALENKLAASNLRNEARQFFNGRLDKDTPANFRANLDRQLAAIGAFTYGGKNQSAIDKQIIALTQGIDPRRLSRVQQTIAASARLNEAGRLDAQEKEAKAIQEKLVSVLESLDKKKELQIDITDPTNRTSIGSTSNVNARYK